MKKELEKAKQNIFCIASQGVQFLKFFQKCNGYGAKTVFLNSNRDMKYVLQT